MLDISQNRLNQKYTKGEIVRRIFWMLCMPLFRMSPRPFFGWRRWLLRLFGARVGRQVHIYNSARIYMPWNLSIDDWSAIGEDAYVYNLGPITIGKYVTISHRAHLCAGTHDYSRPDLPLLKPPIHILDQAWICADAFVGPGVEIGEGAIVGARAVVVKDIEPWMVVAGNPAQPIKKRVVT
jgi:putative colanic acid biosynthesis acetyltransferase WcaF